MKKLLGITLGLMTALGGFVDLGQVVFTMIITDWGKP